MYNKLNETNNFHFNSDLSPESIGTRFSASAQFIAPNPLRGDIANPLEGKRILVTRTREQASVFCERLRALGAVPIEFPTIRIMPPANWSALDAALHRLFQDPSYDWLVLTSANGVNICCQRMQALGYNPRDLQAKQHLRIATIGPATANALRHYDLTADLVPDEYIAESVAAAIIADAYKHGSSIAGQRILLARASEARKVLVSQLQQASAFVDEVAAYDTFPVAHDDSRGQEILSMLRNHQLDIITFTSSSTVRNFVAWLQNSSKEVILEFVNHGRDRIGSLQGDKSGIHSVIPGQLPIVYPQIATIGPITAQTARECGLHVDIEASEFTIDGLIETLIRAYSDNES